MKVVLLCGGKGTRIRDASESLPKPMLEIGGLPILWHIMKYYSMFGHNDFILCLGYKSDAIKNFFLNYKSSTSDIKVSLGQAKPVECMSDHPEKDWNITLAETGLESMTGFRIKKIQKYIDADTFMLNYGDGVGDVDLNALLETHQRNNKTLTLTGVRPPGRFGELRYDEHSTLLGFNEKPQVTVGRISGGFFVCNRKIFDCLPEREDSVFEQGPIRTLVSNGEVGMYKHDGFWQPMDTYREYVLLNQMYSSGEAPWKIW